LLALLAVVLAASTDPAAGYQTPAPAAPTARAREKVIVDSDDAGPRPEAGVSRNVWVRVEGLKMLPAEVVLDMLRLPPNAAVSEKTAREVRKQVLAFLRRTGFELARVRAEVEGDSILVTVEEGQVERIVFVGQLSYQLLRFKQGLVLPDNVFSRPLLERKVKELSETLDMPGVRWELVRTSEVRHRGPQATLDRGERDMPIREDLLLHARRPYEIRVYLPENTLASNLGIDLRSGYLDGLELGLNYPVRNAWPNGRGSFLTEVSGGVGVRTEIGTGRPYAHFSRGLVGANYRSGPLAWGLEVIAAAGVELSLRQRADLQLENYSALTSSAGLYLELEPRKGLRFLGGYGVEWRRLFDFKPASVGPPPPPTIGFLDLTRPFVRLTHVSEFDASALRLDRRHTLSSEVRRYFSYKKQPENGWADLRYQKVFEFGWNDLWLKSHGHLSWGASTFHDELSVGEYLRALFGNEFVPSAVNLQLEYRLSLARDVFKVSLFHDLVLLGVRRRSDRAVTPQLANGFGPGVHFLVLDLFQVDAYLAFGFRRRSQFGTGFSMQIQKAF
jgi:hypothetical protein